MLLLYFLGMNPRAHQRPRFRQHVTAAAATLITSGVSEEVDENRAHELEGGRRMLFWRRFAVAQKMPTRCRLDFMTQSW
jgi:hypothetical protein